MLKEPYYPMGSSRSPTSARTVCDLLAELELRRPPTWFWPSWWGLSLFLTTPLFVWLARARLRDPSTAWAAVGIGLTLVPNITHGNIWFTQFGYRYALDFQPLLFVVLATLFERNMSRLAIAAAVASVAINAYAVWAISTGFVGF